LLAAANVSRNLSDDTTPLATARTLIGVRLGNAAPPQPRTRKGPANLG
jgi:hypothetical protein